MTKNIKDIKFLDPQIDFKKKSIDERLQFIPGTKAPLPSEIEISESGICNRKRPNLYSPGQKFFESNICSITKFEGGLD